MILYLHINDAFLKYFVSVLKTKITSVNLGTTTTNVSWYIFQNGNLLSKNMRDDKLSEQVAERFCNSSA
jgi:hypothetical protein